MARTIWAGNLLLAMQGFLVLDVTATGSGAEKDDIAVVTQWEWNAAKADEARDVDFYDEELANDWTDGMSNGEFH